MKTMPLYEYECKKCHQRLEKIQHFNAPPEQTCPHCGGALKRVISAPAFKFKGSGWYVTDYTKSGNGFEAAHDGHSESNGKPESKADSPNGGSEKTPDAAAPAAKPSPKASSSAGSGASESSGTTAGVSSSGTPNP